MTDLQEIQLRLDVLAEWRLTGLTDAERVEYHTLSALETATLQARRH